ncbi:HAMP domain-containing histidine kinase [Paenibacillus glycanilyticus]|uniref:sensor histidine kinase n=1 Tax=Paenibacillus glycanilyticus TaxID=126569 RepID=UPI00203D9185|nr:HAMP domain-containing sensor histidine kinase [Paenibacillus glycanilyticus]MCM3629332.1 HAMP domain-containing histidine kinase [Paenibacillus glycanilyticus]
MKLWHKVFLCTFLLFEVLFNGASFYLIEHNFNRNLKTEIDLGLTERRIIASQLQSDWSYAISLSNNMGGTSEDSAHFTRNNAQKYTRTFENNRIFLEFRNSAQVEVFNNFERPITGYRPELNAPSSDRPTYILRDIGKQTYLFVTGKLALSGTNYTMSYIRDISGVYSDKSAQIRLFFQINILVTFILGIGLYGVIRYLTRSIRSLTESAQTVARGLYSQRVSVHSGDEIGILAQNFNRMAEAVEEKVNELELTAMRRQKFIEFLTHELRTPLTSIIGYADLLRTTKYNEKVFFKAMNYIYSEGRRLESLSFKLMDLILLGNEKPELQHQDIMPLCLEVEEALQPRLEGLDLTLILSIEPYRLLTDKDLFLLVCTNLLDNAIKASSKGGRIYLKGYLVNHTYYAIEVEDEGIGIPEQDVPKVFEPFFMVDKVRTRSQHGAGLGLAICSEIVKLHEGKIEITSREEVGTQVKILFPQN